MTDIPIPVPQTPLAPLERFAPPDLLDGRGASNRVPAGAPRQIAAETDVEAVLAWLSEFRHSEHTLRGYRKEAERLLLWSVLTRGKPLSGLGREDLAAYEDFLADPQPATFWCGPKAPRRSPDWRPFVGPLSPGSVRHALVVVDSLFGYLVEAGYLAGNPLALRRRRQGAGTKGGGQRVERFLDVPTWNFLLSHVEAMPRDTSRRRDEAERARFLFSLLYLLGPRVGEVARHAMGSFERRRGQWWWHVVGKGNKEAVIPVPDELMTALGRYRAHLGLPPSPTPGDPTPLVLSLKGGKGITADMVYKIVKRTVREAAAALQERDPLRAERLREASTHWLRHTAISHQVDAGIGLVHLKKSARHEKLETTAGYLHAEDDLWHEDVQRHRLRRLGGQEEG